MTMRHPNPEMLLRIAQADAYAMAVEYVKPSEHPELITQALRLERYLRHPVHSLGAGQYTDDTQMSIAVAEVLLGGELAREAFADAFVRAFWRDPRDGYARHFQAFLEKTRTGAEFLRNIRPDSDKNGAAMRAVPIGVLADPVQVMRVAALQAQLTHDTLGGTGSAQMVALMSHYALHEAGPLSDLPRWLAHQMHLPRGFPRWEGDPVKGPGVGMATALAVLTLVSEQPSLLDILRTTIEWGGDTDSVAAIAWGIASARMREPLPEFFEVMLEPGRPYGPAFLRGLGDKLAAKYG